MIKIGGCFSCNVRNRPFSQNQRELKMFFSEYFFIEQKASHYGAIWLIENSNILHIVSRTEIKVKKCSLNVMSVTVELPTYSISSPHLPVFFFQIHCWRRKIIFQTAETGHSLAAKSDKSCTVWQTCAVFWHPFLYKAVAVKVLLLLLSILHLKFQGVCKKLHKILQ